MEPHVLTLPFSHFEYIHDFYEPLPYILLQNTLKIKN